MNELQFSEITRWQEETFPEANSESKVHHLLEEVNELLYAIVTNDSERRLEFADCFLLLLGAASKDNMTYKDITDCVQEKLEINKKRVWGTPDENGVVNHLKS